MSINSLLQSAFTHQREGRLDLAEHCYLDVIKSAPTHWSARFGLAEVLNRTKRYDAAIGWLTPMLTEDPEESVSLNREIGFAHANAGRPERALEHFKSILEELPNDAETLHLVANFEQSLNMHEEADAHFRRALERKLLITVPAVTARPAFCALFVFAPGRGNTPFAYLVEGAPFESNVLNLLQDFKYDDDALRNGGDVVVNLIADVDQGGPIVAIADEFVERIGKPIVNHPRLIKGTGREAIAKLIGDTPGCVVPQTRLYTADALRKLFADTAAFPWTFPLLVRRAGTHGGSDFELVQHIWQLRAFVERLGDCDYYLTPFVDYRSADGHYRKYRFFYVDGEILPYHLAIGDHWKVHHATTAMAVTPWMQTEEQAFLEHPEHVFGAAQYDALRSIGDTIGLDYFGIDCALDAHGAVVVFEVNACMLAHGDNAAFPYKTPAVERIKHAFHAMLARIVQRTSHVEPDEARIANAA
ncbi:tetratricopeptide repeat protein [Paraburkholderia rhizosphaerae]|uniref:Tetratricopeptide repeat protein n=1 Tax=Paraburkholderia rhizosphaerae TaxID=480658 RepID=A0A4V3HFN3_9BURK|nr:tetratricopeptide repeat protein [Paraburkholderia rhizosphaerae]TDY54099.1 tetratricopeptide repeat protein [Paraburkholderia rhizosphaerae]